MPAALVRWTASTLMLLGMSLARADITVGAPFDLTGPVGALATTMRQGAELAMNQVNQQGGVLGQNYRLEFADTACDPDKSVPVIRRLVDNPAVLALVGPVCSGVTLRQARSVAIPSGVVTLSVASASSLITGLEDRDLVFRTAASDAVKGQAMARVAFESGIRSMALSHASDAYNTGVAQVFAAAFQALGGRITVHQSHQPGLPDYSGQAKAAVAGAKDLALFAYYGSGGVQYLKDLFAEPGVRSVIGTDGLMSKDLATALNPEHLGRITMVTAAADTSREAYKRWTALAQANKLPPDGAYVANAYDAAFMMALAIEAAKAPDRAKVSAGLRAIAGPEGTVIYPGEFKKAKALLNQGAKINYEGASGPVDFDRAGDVAGRVSINRFANGAWQSSLLK